MVSVFRLRTGADCGVDWVVDEAGGSVGVITLAWAVGVDGVTLEGGVATFGRLGNAGEMVDLVGGSIGTVEGPGVAAGVETVDDDPGVATAGVGVEAEDPAGEGAADPGVPEAADRSVAAGGCRLLIPSRISNCAGSNNLSAWAKNSLGVTAFDCKRAKRLVSCCPVAGDTEFRILCSGDPACATNAAQFMNDKRHLELVSYPINPHV